MTGSGNKLLENVVSLKDTSGRIATDSCLILQYHRVAGLFHDPSQLAVEPYIFEAQMEYLTQNFNTISLDQLKYHLERSIPFQKKTVVLTFDGAYADMLYTAKDILENYGLCATVFAASVGVVYPEQFWFDTLEDFLIANKVCGELVIEIQGRTFNRQLQNDCDRFQAYSDLYTILLSKTPAEQKDIIEQVTGSLELNAQDVDDHRVLNAQELEKLEEDGLISIGGYTHNCVNLSCLSKLQQAEEICKNKRTLEEVLGHSIKYFAYPFGTNNVYSGQTDGILEKLGFTLACGNCYGAVSIAGETNYYQLPRVKVGNWNPYVLDRFLARFFG